jgi:hypothetical protein
MKLFLIVDEMSNVSVVPSLSPENKQAMSEGSYNHVFELSTTGPDLSIAEVFAEETETSTNEELKFDVTTEPVTPTPAD